MEPVYTWCDLANRWADEDEADARARRFAAKLDRLAAKLGLARHVVARRLTAASYPAWLVAQAAA